MAGIQVDPRYWTKNGYGLKTLADEVIAKIDFWLNFSHLLEKRNNEYLSV